MGLDTTHDAWHGAYSAFSRWRDMVAVAAGYEMAREAPRNLDWPARLGREYIAIDWGHVDAKNYDGAWDSIPCNTKGPDPLIILFAHSDCDGYIEPEHAALIADRLAEILPLLPEEGTGHIASPPVKTQAFIDGCRAAAAAGERLEFH